MKIMKYIWPVLAIMFVQCSNPIGPVASKVTAEEIMIYKTLIEMNWGLGGEIIVVDSTSSFIGFFGTNTDNYYESKEGLEKASWQSFLSRNRSRKSWIPALGARDVTVHVIPEAQESRWDTLYPGAEALVIFSRVGFNAEYTQAVVSINILKGELNVKGGVLVMEKYTGEWKITDWLIFWIS